MKITLLFLSVFLSATLFGQNPGSGVTDIDGNYYETVIIGNQEWMAENLRTTSYKNGESIFYEPDDDTTDYNFFGYQSLWSDAWTYYRGNILYENPYGKLYNYIAVADERGICPVGWHVPTKIEANNLISFLGGESVAGGAMKTTGLDYWEYPNFDATNSSGFSAYPGGFLGNDGWYSFEGMLASFWTATEDSSSFGLTEAYGYGVNWQNASASISSGYKLSFVSLRCISNASSSLTELTSSKNLIQILDLMGRETTFKPNTPLIYVYDDGSIEKVFSVEY